VSWRPSPPGGHSFIPFLSSGPSFLLFRWLIPRGGMVVLPTGRIIGRVLAQFSLSSRAPLWERSRVFG